MSEELEALKRMSHYGSSLKYDNRDYAKDYQIVEKALKDYETFVKELCKFLGLEYLQQCNDLELINSAIRNTLSGSHYNELIKCKKVLDILKEETTFVFEEMNVKTHGVIVKVYQVVIGGIVGIDFYRKEKYDLLKEMLYVQEENRP